MSTLYIRPPPQSAADSTSRWLELACPFALVSGGGLIEREGVASFAQLSGAAADAQRVVVVLAASDVTLLRVQVPPLSAAKLKAALPNLVEERLIADPSACVVVAGGLPGSFSGNLSGSSSGGLRTVAVVQRDWLKFLANTLIASGARRIAALPAQLCLPCQPEQQGQPGQPGQPGSVTAAISEQGAGLDLTLRFTEQEGIGLAIAPAMGAAEGLEAQEALAREAIRTLCALVPEAPLTLYVPQPAMRVYQNAISRHDVLNRRINILADNWPRWIAGAQGAAPDLMAGLGAAGGRGLAWREWRWPMGLATAVLLANAIALNADWWRLKSEAGSLRATQIQIYQSAYPKETVILDPLAQMRQKIDAAKRNAGQPAPDDFTAILAAFGEVCGSVMPGRAASVIEALEYRERSLIVRLKPVLSRVEGANIEVPLQQMKTALAERGLSLDLWSPDAGVPDALSARPAGWKIRSAK